MPRVQTKKPNVILVTIDALRADRLGCMGYPRNPTPFLDSLAKRGALFTRALSTGPGSPQSFVSILTSTHPLDYGGYTRVGPPRVLLSEAFRRAGYTTTALHCAAYLSGYFGYDRGWDVFEYMSPFFKGKEMSPGMRKGSWRARVLKITTWAHTKFDNERSLVAGFVIFLEKLFFLPRKIAIDFFDFRPAFLTAGEMNKKLASLLPKKPRKPLFLWIHYMDAHGPFGLFLRQEKAFGRRVKYYLADYAGFLFGHYSFSRFFRRFFVDAYDESVRYADAKIKELFEYLSKTGVLDDESVVAIVADHGEEFFEHGQLGHKPKLFFVNLHVPLIIYSPARILPAVRTEPVSLIDLGPTLLDAARIAPPRAFKGKSLLRPGTRPVIAQIVDEEADLTNPVFLGATVAWNGYRLIHIAGEKLLFSISDTKETRNLYDTSPGVVAELETLLKPYESICPPGKRA